MKNIFKLLVILLIFQSCSDKLTESKVEELINDCSEKSPNYGTYKLDTGKIEFLSENTYKNYLKLQEKGFLKVEKKEEKYGWMIRNYYQIELTEKCKPYVIETNKYSETNSNKIKLFTYKLDKVGSIQEIPSMNIAEVSVTYKKDAKTPFYDFFETDKTDFITKKIGIKKTENQGWIYCEN